MKSFLKIKPSVKISSASEIVILGDIDSHRRARGKQAADVSMTQLTLHFSSGTALHWLAPARSCRFSAHT